MMKRKPKARGVPVSHWAEPRKKRRPRPPSPGFLEPLDHEPPPNLGASAQRDNPRVLRSFINNFLADDLGTFRDYLDLAKHADDSGTPCTDATLQEVADLHPGVRGICANGCADITDVGLWALARSCVELRSLELSGCHQISHIGLRSLSLRCWQIDTLDLRNCTLVNDLGLRVLGAGCWGLRNLRLQGCNSITDAGVAEVAQCCKHLQVLDLRGCHRLCEFGEKALVELGRNCTELQELDLTGCRHVKDGGVRALARGCRGLRSLHLSNCEQLTGASVRAIGRGCCNLETLSLAGCGMLKNRDVWTLAEALTRLTTLSLRNVHKLKHHGLRALCEWCFELERLDLGGCPQIDDQGLIMLSNGLTSLRSLDITGLNRVSEEGVGAVCHGCTRLTMLEAGKCKRITRDYLRDLSHELPFVQISPKRAALEPLPGAQTLIEQTERMRVDNAAACKIQKMHRGVKARGGVELLRRQAMRRFVVPKMQALLRGYLVRKAIREARHARACEVAALLVQRFYRGHKGRKQAQRQRRIVALRADQSLAATRIQATFRGWVGRNLVAGIRRELALRALRASEARGREEVMALRVQRLWRGRHDRIAVMAMHEAERQRQLREEEAKKSALVMQTAWRGRLARGEATAKRQALVEEAGREAAVRKLQANYRGHNGRQRAEAARIRRQWQLESKSAMVIQKAWRGAKGRYLAAVFKSFMRLQARECSAAKLIQGWWRGRQGRQLFEFLKLLRQQKKLEEESAIVIQRLYRGHKGREEWEVRYELHKLEVKLAPLLQQQADIEAELAEEQGRLDAKLDWMEKSTNKLASTQDELEEVVKHRAKFYDSANITGTMQRYQTSYLRTALQKQVEELRALIEMEQKNLDKLSTIVRSLEKSLRSVRKELLPQQLNAEKNVRETRAQRLRERLRVNYRTACAIQRCFRGWRVRSAIKQGGNFWTELWDDANQVVYYYNTYTEEYANQIPWAMKVLLERPVLPTTTGWVESYDEESGYPYYYHAGTGEYRWDRPPNFDPSHQNANAIDNTGQPSTDSAKDHHTLNSSRLRKAGQSSGTRMRADLSSTHSTLTSD